MQEIDMPEHQAIVLRKSGWKRNLKVEPDTGRHIGSY